MEYITIATTPTAALGPIIEVFQILLGGKIAAKARDAVRFENHSDGSKEFFKADVVAEGFKSDSGTRGRGEGLSHDVLGSFVSGYPPEFPLEADLGVTEEVCLSTVCAVRLPLTGKGAQLQGSGNLKVGEAERRLEWYRGEPDPAQLGRCLDDRLGLLWGQRA
jgi:hypothetical protein